MKFELACYKSAKSKESLKVEITIKELEHMHENDKATFFLPTTHSSWISATTAVTSLSHEASLGNNLASEAGQQRNLQQEIKTRA